MTSRHWRDRGIDVLFVVSPRNRGWVLDTICQEVARRMPGDVGLHYLRRSLPKARTYFFSHYSLFQAVADRRKVTSASTIVLFTHPDHEGSRRAELVEALNRATWVLSMGSLHAGTLIDWGVDPERVRVEIPGTDPNRFTSHTRTGGGFVGLSSAYYERKNPDLVYNVVRAMPHRSFLLIGKGWREWARFDEVVALPNFRYEEGRDYEQYPRLYHEMDVFLSPSRLEGGPVGLLEAMMCNVVPVATGTGYAPDLIDHGHNGFLCQPDADTATFRRAVDAAFELGTDVRRTVEHLTWDRYVAKVKELVG